MSDSFEDQEIDQDNNPIPVIISAEIALSRDDYATAEKALYKALGRARKLIGDEVSGVDAADFDEREIDSLLRSATYAISDGEFARAEVALQLSLSEVRQIKGSQQGAVAK